MADELRQLLPAFAALTGGTATICDHPGAVLLGDGWLGDIDNGGVNLDGASSAGQLVTVYQKDGVVTAIIQVGEEYLVLENRQRMEDAAQYRQIIEESLPFIAQAVGGDAVLFDRFGFRVKAFHPDGKPNPEAVGVLNELCSKAMEEARPSIGPSVLSPGSMAVRIPLAQDYGLAFNNKLATIQRQRLMDNARQYQYARYQLEDIIGEGIAITKAKNLARDAAKSFSTVLLSGETGTGKELFAQAIHNLSTRSVKPFVAINCGALPNNLVETSLFGYSEGAFTGARKQGQPGVFEQANGGTLLLDEISEMPFNLQVKLLRVIQEREVRRVGASKSIPVDVRIIVSTNKALAEEVREGRFRADLYFRLNVMEIAIPPLRERKEDLLGLTYYFIEKFSAVMGKKVTDITPVAMKVISSYNWPGNVRELQNCLEHVLNVIEGESIRPEYLPQYILNQHGGGGVAVSLYETFMDNAERELVLRAMKLCDYNKTEAAKRLGLNRTTLWRILKRHGIHDNAVANANGVAKMNG
ncbi:MAG: sigma 54-interacting transcriptional regulator [Negativicutes bacterium]|nr:sigma 54-interacting transcriptional regulator [Negativicutes bacterium]